MACPVPELEKLLDEEEAIQFLGLHNRPNPAGALRWLIRKKRLACVRLGRGILQFKPADLKKCVERCYSGAV